MGRIYFGKSPAEVAAEDELDSQDAPESVARPEPAEVLSEETPDLETPSREPDARELERGWAWSIGFDEVVEQRSPHALLKAVQPGVVDSLRSGMKSWFGFYFLTGEGTGQERLDTAITGLRGAADRLRELSDRLRDEDGLGQVEAEFVETYRRAVDGWAKAMSTIAQGIELDQQRAALDGLALLVEASDIAKLSVRSPLYPNLLHTRAGPSLVGESLAYLVELSPAARVSKGAARRAKQPWERSIIAAGSPFRRL